MHIRRGWTIWTLTAALLMAASPVWAQHRPVSAMNWAFGGTVHTVARAGHIAIVGGRFNAVASRRNITGGLAVVSPVTSQRALRAAEVHGNVNAVIADGSGGWFVGGNFTFVGAHRHPQIVHLMADGSVDTAWTGRVNGRVMALALANGTLYAGGEFTLAGSGAGATLPASRTNTAAFAAADGTLLPAFAGGADGVVTALAVSGNTVYAGGDFATFGGSARAHLAAYDIAGDTVSPWNPGTNGTVREILPFGNTVFVGGAFTTAAGTARSYLAQIETATGVATIFAPVIDGHVTALAVTGTKLYVGGRFTHVAGAARNHAASLDVPTGVVQAWDPNADDAVLGFSIAGATVYMGGEFLNVGGKVRLHTAAVDATTGALAPWHPATNDPVRVVAASTTRVVLGGSFEALGGHLRKNLAAIDLDTGKLLPWRPRPDGAVFALQVAGDRRVYVGGAFTTIAGQPRAHLAAFDLGTRALASWNPGADADVLALASFTDTSNVTTVYAGGDFLTAGGQARSRIAAIGGASGQAVPGFVPGNTDDSVLALEVNANHVYAGGRFVQLGGAGLGHLGRLDRLTGAADAAWAPSPDGPVRALSLGGQTVYAGGAFGTVAGVARTNIAALGMTAPAVATGWQPNPDGAVHAIDRDGPYVFLGGAFRRVDQLLRPRLATVLAAATGNGPYLLPWKPRWFGLVNAIDARLEGVLAGGEALPDLDDQEIDPVGRLAFYPRAGVPGRPGAPVDPHTITNGSQVAIEWRPPLHGAEPLFYTIDVGSSPGASNIARNAPVGSDTHADVPNVPAGTYYLRIQAVAAGGIGPASDELELVVGPSTCGARPEPPTDLDAVVSGGTVTITWDESVTPGVTGYRISANPYGLGSFFTTTVPAGTTTVSAPAPPGVFAVRVRALSPCGASPASNDIVVGIGGVTLPPGEPLDLTATIAGSAVTFAWTAPIGGGAPAGYIIEVGSGPGMSDIVRFPLTATSFTAPNVPAGTYFVRVRAVNGAGEGDVSSEIEVTVP